MRVAWSDFKANISAQGFKVRYVLLADVYCLTAFDPGGIECLACRVQIGTADCDDFVANFKDGWSVPQLSGVQTLREVKDLRLNCVAIEAAADEDGLCVATSIVPATGEDEGRVIDWGEAWITGTSHDDDKITKIKVDMPDGEGGWTEVSSYTDQDSDDEGWWLPPKPTTAEVEPLGYYGKLYGGMRIRIEAQCGGASFTGRTLKVNLAWGIRDAS